MKIVQTAGILQRYNEDLSAMPTVLQTLKLGLTFGASTATCEISFSTLKNVITGGICFTKEKQI